MENSKDGRDFNALKSAEDEARNERMRSKKDEDKLSPDQISREAEDTAGEQGLSEKKNSS